MQLKVPTLEITICRSIYILARGDLLVDVYADRPTCKPMGVNQKALPTCISDCKGFNGHQFLPYRLCRYQVLTDKGTLDAVGLSANASENRNAYRHSVWKLLEPSGIFIITSCNSTAEELQVSFTQRTERVCCMSFC